MQGYFATQFFCVECNKELTTDQRMYSFGRCPFCGYKDKGTGTIVETNEKQVWIPVTRRSSSTRECVESIIGIFMLIISFIVFVFGVAFFSTLYE